MIATIANAFSVPEIRKKILFTAVILALYRLGAHIPAPGVDIDAVKYARATSSAAANILGFLNLFSGGASRTSRSSRSGSCPTSRPRSSCSC